MERIIKPNANKLTINKKKNSISELKNNCIGKRYKESVKIINTIENIIKKILNREIMKYKNS